MLYLAQRVREEGSFWTWLLQETLANTTNQFAARQAQLVLTAAMRCVLTKALISTTVGHVAMTVTLGKPVAMVTVWIFRKMKTTVEGVDWSAPGESRLTTSMDDVRMGSVITTDDFNHIMMKVFFQARSFFICSDFAPTNTQCSELDSREFNQNSFHRFLRFF